MRQTISLKTLYVIHVLPVFKLEIQCLNVLCFFVELHAEYTRTIFTLSKET